MTLKEFIAERKLPYDALGLLAKVDKGTISRIANGRAAAKPEVVVSLARALGTSARRMQSMCDASWTAAHEDDEVIPA